MEYRDQILDSDIEQKTSDVDTQQIISLNKFILLCFASFGIYELWWIYKAWRFYKQKEKSDIYPAARAIFSIFFLYSLMKKILADAQAKSYSGSYASGSLFCGFILLNLMGRAPDPLWLISIFSFACLIPTFNALNYLKQNSADIIAVEQDSFNTRQIVLLVVGIIFWGLIIYGIFMPEGSGLITN